MNLSYWFNGGDYMSGIRQDIVWTWVTILLSALVAIGYALIAMNWYFQAKLSRSPESKATLRRLRLICLCCVVSCAIFYATDAPWLVWRFYDVSLVVFAFSTWSFVLKMRGL